jgi:hypothetical protein
MSSMSPRNVATSVTTQNVAGGVVLTAASVIGLIHAVREIAPGVLWDAAHDETVAYVATAVLIPLVSRAVALVRERLGW